MAEQEALLSQETPVLFAKSDEFFMDDLIVLHSVLSLGFALELAKGLFLLELDHGEIVGHSVKLVVEQDQTFEVD